MNKESAIEIKKHALSAIENLNKILPIAQKQCSQDEYLAIKRRVGASVGEIQVALLDPIYEDFKELDDLVSLIN